MSTPPVTRFKTSQVVGEKGLKVIDDIKVTYGTDNDASLYWDSSGSAVTHIGGKDIFAGEVVVTDDNKIVWGTGLDASVYWDNTNSRLTHAGAEEIFRKYVTAPLYATTDGRRVTNAKFGILAPDRPVLITAARVSWTQVPGTTTAIPLFIKKRKYSQVTGTAYNLLYGDGHSADMTIIGTTFFPHEYTLTATAAYKTLAAGDLLYGSIDVSGVLVTAGIGGALAIEYEVYG